MFGTFEIYIRSTIMYHSLLYLLVISSAGLSQSPTEEETAIQTNGDEVAIPTCNMTCTYTAWAFDANCRQRQMVNVPQECQEAKMLDLRDNRIRRLPARVFAPFYNLLYVDLEDNGVTEIDVNAFVNNDLVRHIYLQSNNLQIIRRGTFSGVPNVLQMYLNSNRIATIETGAFAGLTKLETLFLSENNMDEIPTGVLAGLERLRYFHMTHNQITVIRSNTFKDLAVLRQLNLINNNIRTIEPNAFKGLVSLRILRLAYNDISIIGFHAFSPLRQLSQLDLYSNKIQTMTNNSVSIQRFDELFLGDNPLECDCKIESVRRWFKYHNFTDSKANATCRSPSNLKGAPISTLEVEACPPPTPKPLEGDGQHEVTEHKDQSHTYEKQYNIDRISVRFNTYLVIIIVCIVLFSICFLGFICFVYHAYVTKPSNKQFYRQISRTESDGSNSSKKDLTLTVNPTAVE